MGKYTDDDYCDIYEKKICDNCGKCLEEEGIDIRAIKIEDIAKDVAENKALEEEYMAKLKELKEEEEAMEEFERELPPLDIDEEELKAAYKKLQEETGHVECVPDMEQGAIDYLIKKQNFFSFFLHLCSLKNHMEVLIF